MSRFAITSAMVISSLHTVAMTKLKDLIRSIVFDPQLSYETTLNSLRVQDGLNDDSKPVAANTSLPALAWSRDSIQRASTGRVGQIVTSPVGGSVNDLKFTPVQFKYRFQYYSQSINDLEVFEALWLTNQAINSVSTVSVKIPGIDAEIDFAINWERDLEELFFNKDTNYYKSLGGSATITGVVVTGELELPAEDYPRIEEVTFTVKDCSGRDLEVKKGSLDSDNLILWNNQ